MVGRLGVDGCVRTATAAKRIHHHEENVDAEVAAGQKAGHEVKEHHRRHGDRAQTVESGVARADSRGGGGGSVARHG